MEKYIVKMVYTFTATLLFIWTLELQSFPSQRRTASSEIGRKKPAFTNDNKHSIIIKGQGENVT
jgi:hypothetical protein